MNRFHTQSFIDCVLRNSVSLKSIKIQSYGGGRKFSTNSGSTYSSEKKIFLRHFLPFLSYLLWVPSYAETYNTVCEEPLDLQYGIY